MSANEKFLAWQEESLCGQKENRHMQEFFFSSETAEKYQAKNLCFLCPVRAECLKWALEHKQIWGIWGGKDEGEIRRTLSVSFNGQEIRRQRFPQCPYCNARPKELRTLVVDTPHGGRWATMRLVTCGVCDFTWRSRTSANAVEAYHLQREEKLEKAKTKKKKPSKKKAG